MDQFPPTYHAHKYQKLDRQITASEYEEVVDYAFMKGLRKGIEVD